MLGSPFPKLQDLETAALNYCGHDSARGKEVLFGSSYIGNKTVLLQGIQDVTHAAEEALQNHEDSSDIVFRVEDQ